MKTFVIALALAGAVLFGARESRAQAANDPAITWRVTGTVCQVPNNPACITFSCDVTVADPVCHGPANVDATSPPPNLPRMRFAAPNTTTFGLTFLPCAPCGGPATCTPLTVTDAQPAAVSATFAAGAYTASQAEFKAYFTTSCRPCFGGTTPLFTVAWSAVTVGSVPTTTTTTAAPTTTTTTTTTTTAAPTTTTTTT